MALITEVAEKMVGSEDLVAAAWAESYKAHLQRPEDKSIPQSVFMDQVKLFLTSLSDGDFDSYFNRIAEKGLELARSRAPYEYLILSFHLYEDAVAPYLQKLFHDSFAKVISVLDHLYHNVIGIMARAYFDELERERVKLVSIIAHDLRVPLTAIMLNSEGIWKNKFPPSRQAEISEQIWRAGKLMAELIESMLEYGKLKSRLTVLDLKDTDIVSLAQEAVEFMMVEAAEKRVSLMINGVPPEHSEALPQVLTMADPKLIKRAILNYLSNAIKHARSNVSLRISDSSDYIILSVQDDGRGISKDLLQAVFDDYFVVPDRHAGTGLGLPSARMIVELHNGKCGVESELGRGSRFYFSLPKVGRGLNQPS
ncbi:MAG: HAMP domain-containing sensor histidine kinase [Bdellovibrionota bacterium]